MYQRAVIREVVCAPETASCGICAGREVTRCPAPVNPGLPEFCIAFGPQGTGGCGTDGSSG